jgi:hypothetical protein
MKISKLTITIDNFDGAAMTDDSTGEVQRILRDIILQIDRYDMVTSGVLDGCSLRDINGNEVGKVSCEWDEDDGLLCPSCGRDREHDSRFENFGKCPTCGANFPPERE